MNCVHVLYSKPVGKISRHIYGHFTEQLSNVIYDGVWVGENSSIPNVRGIRKDLVEKLKEINPPVIRWPGGCIAENHNWRDGIGPRTGRPTKVNTSYRQDHGIETNEFGTHEFMDFCRQTGAEPYFCANIASNTPMELFNWMEYCNMPRGLTTLTRLRESNGSPEPFGIKYWGMGNENTLHGGMMTAEDYCAAYCRFMAPTYTVSEGCYFIASGPICNNVEWSRRFFENYNARGYWEGKILNGYSLHLYSVGEGNDDTFSESEWYQQLRKSLKMIPLLADHRSLLERVGLLGKVELIIDEWGSWTSLKRVPSFDRPLFEQVGTMREALIAGITLNIFNNNCDIVHMANLTELINYIHSLFMSKAEKLFVTPTFYVFKMMREHQDALCVKTVCACEAVEGVDEVMASSSIKDGQTLVTLVNTRYEKPVEVKLCLHGAHFSEVELVTLVADTPQAHNSFEHPDAVKSVERHLEASGDELTLVLPAASVVSLRFHHQ